MTQQKLVLRAPTRTETEASAGRWFVAVMLVALTSGVALSTLLPGPLVLPALAIAMVVPGFVIATLLWAGGLRMNRHHSAWEAVGALILIGFAAGMLADSGEALAALEQLMPAAGKRAGQ